MINTDGYQDYQGRTALQRVFFFLVGKNLFHYSLGNSPKQYPMSLHNKEKRQWGIVDS